MIFRILRLLSLLSAGVSLLSACSENGPRTYRATTTKEVDLGIIKEIDGPLTVKLLLRNDFKDTLYPVQLYTPCRCTKVEFGKKPVAPGEDEVLEVTYNPAYNPGPMTEQIQIFYTASPVRARMVTIKGEVIGYNHPIEEDRPYAFGEGLYMSHKVLSYGLLREGETSDMFFRYGNGNTRSAEVTFDIPEQWKPYFRLRQPGRMKADERDTLHARFTMPEGADTVTFAVRPLVDGKPTEEVLTVRAYPSQK